MTTNTKHSMFLLGVFIFSGTVLVLTGHIFDAFISFFLGIGAAFGMRADV